MKTECFTLFKSVTESTVEVIQVLDVQCFIFWRWILAVQLQLRESIGNELSF